MTIKLYDVLSGVTTTRTHMHTHLETLKLSTVYDRPFILHRNRNRWCQVRSPRLLNVLPHAPQKVLSWVRPLAAQVLFFMHIATSSTPSLRLDTHCLLS